MSMRTRIQLRPDLFLLLSLLLAILLTPVLDRNGWQRFVLATITFVPVILSTVRLSQIKLWAWPSLVLMLVNAAFVVAGNTFHSQALTGIRWVFLAAFFAISAMGLFSYLKGSRIVTEVHLYTAVNIYLLIGLLWTCVYLAMEAFFPGSIQFGNHPEERDTDLLYFSLITLSTVGYGDIVPVSGEARILSALEGVTGVLYMAVTVALLVSRFRTEPLDSTISSQTHSKE